MTTAYWCVLVGALMPIVWTAIAKIGGANRMPMSANVAPREFLATLSGHQKRADYAQQNAFEAFPAFAAAVIIAQVTGAAQPAIDLLALTWILVRFGHGLAYVVGWSSLRSLLYFAGLACVIGLFVISPAVTEKAALLLR